MTPGGPNHTHPSPDRVLACPGCDVAGDIYERQDDTVRCRKCGHECDAADLIERESQRGRNLDFETRSAGGKVSRSNGVDVDG